MISHCSLFLCFVSVLPQFVRGKPILLIFKLQNTSLPVGFYAQSFSIPANANETISTANGQYAVQRGKILQLWCQHKAGTILAQTDEIFGEQIDGTGRPCVAQALTKLIAIHIILLWPSNRGIELLPERDRTRSNIPPQ